MKICIFSTTFFPKIGGAERFIHGLADNLTRRGHEVYVLVPYDPSLSIDNLVDYKIIRLRFVRLFRSRRRFLELVLFLNLVCYFLIYRFNAVQAVILYPAGYVSSLLTKIFGVPSILRPTGEDIQVDSKIGYGLRMDPFINKRVEKALEMCSKVIAISPSIQKDLLKILGERTKISIIDNGLDLEKFTDPIAYDIKRDLSLERRDKVIISVGRNHPKKDYKTLVKAFLLVAREFDNIYLVLVGGGMESLKSFVPRSLEERVLFLGQISERRNLKRGKFEFPPKRLVDYLRTSDIYVSTSLIEGSPNAVLEAIAACLPIVAVDAPGTRDYVLDNKNGILVPVGKEQDLAKAVIKVLSNSSIRDRFVKENERLRERFSWSNIAAKYEEVYNYLT